MWTFRDLMWTFRTICGARQDGSVWVQGNLLVHGEHLFLVDRLMVMMVHLGLVLLVLQVLDGVLLMCVHLGLVLLVLQVLNRVLLMWVHLGLVLRLVLGLGMVWFFWVLLSIHLGMELLLFLALDLVVDLVLDILPVSSSKNRFLIQTALTDFLPRNRLEQNMNPQLPPDSLLLCR